MEDSSTSNELGPDQSELANSDDMLEYGTQLPKSDESGLVVVWISRRNRSSTENMKSLLDESLHTKSDSQSGCNSSDSLKNHTKDQEEEECNEHLGLVINRSDMQEDSGTAPTSEQEDTKPSDPEMSAEEVNQLESDLDVIETKSLQSYKSEMDRPPTTSEEQLHPTALDESHSLMQYIDLSKPSDEGRPQWPVRPDISARLLALLTDRSQWDIKVYIGDYQFCCHLCVLQAYSLYFRHCKLDESCVVRLPMHRVTPKSFHIVYNWMVQDNPTQRKHISNRRLLELYSAAKFLRVKELMHIVWSTLEAIKSENEAFILLPDMKYVDMQILDILCFGRISRFFLTFVASLEFVELDDNCVCRLLSSHNVGVNSEIEIFYSTVRWLSHKWRRRQHLMPQLLGCVRFGLLSPLFLRFLQNRQSTRVMDYIAQCPSVQERINRAFIYVSAELYCMDPMQSLPFTLPEFEVPEQRRWLYDKNCPYHHDLRCSQRQFFTYEQFLAYLETLHETGPDYWRNLEYLLPSFNCSSRVLAE